MFCIIRKEILLHPANRIIRRRNIKCISVNLALQLKNAKTKIRVQLFLKKF